LRNRREEHVQFEAGIDPFLRQILGQDGRSLNLGFERLYEKVTKVKADVAALLNF